MARKPRTGTITLTQIGMAIGLAILLSYVVMFIEVKLQGDRGARRLAALESEVAALEAERDRLLKELAYTKTDEYVEKAAREELKWIRPGEKAFVPVPKTGAGGPAPTETPTPSPSPMSWWERVRDWLSFPKETPAP